MAHRRAFIAGLGTTGVLVAFALLLLAVVGALMAFRGWPGGEQVDSAEGVSLDGTRLISSAPAPFVSVVPPEARDTSGPRRRLSRAAARGKRASADRQEVAGVNATDGAGGTGDQDGGAGGGGRGGSAPDQSSLGSPTGPGGVSQQLADGVSGVTQGQVGGLPEPVGQVVRDTGTAVSETVRELGARAEAIKKP